MLIRLVPFNRLDCAFQGSVKVVVPVILAHSSSCGWAMRFAYQISYWAIRNKIQ